MSGNRAMPTVAESTPSLTPFTGKMGGMIPGNVSMTGVALLFAATVFYAGYNLLIKQSSVHAEMAAVTTITATIALQVAALSVSVLFLAALRVSGVETFVLPAPAYWWAIGAGLCIGAAEICYFYIFGGSPFSTPFPVSVATPVIVGGAVVLATLGAWWFFRESMGAREWLGAGLILAGVVALAGR